MSEKQKRKNSDIMRSIRIRLYHLYKYPAVQTRHIYVPVSPETCLLHLQQLQAAHQKWSLRDTIYISHPPFSKVDVTPIERGMEYEFKVNVVKSGRNGYQRDVKGRIVDDGYGRSLVTLRAQSLTAAAIGVFIGLLLIIFWLVNPTSLVRTAGTYITMFLLFPIIHVIGRYDHIEALEYIYEHFVKAQDLLAPGKTELTPKQARRLRHNGRKS